MHIDKKHVNAAYMDGNGKAATADEMVRAGMATSAAPSDTQLPAGDSDDRRDGEPSGLEPPVHDGIKKEPSEIQHIPAYSEKDNPEAPIDESVSLYVSRNNMEAYIHFTAPYNGGKELTESDIRAFLDIKGIVFGIDDGIINTVFSKGKDYDKKYLVAKGIAPEKGTDGYLEFLFDNTAKIAKPLELEDGSVDYHKLSLIEKAKPGQVLVRHVKGAPGKDGINIYGRRLRAKQGKKAPKLPVGKNVSIAREVGKPGETSIVPDKNGDVLISDVFGEIIYLDRRVNVSEVLVIRSDVGPATGDIDFSGSVHIRGNVVNDFKIRAAGNIEIEGTVEGAVIESESNIMISGGLTGMGKARIIAGGNISAKFMSDAYVSAGGDIYTDSALRCDIKCMNNLEMMGGKGLIAGGSAMVGNIMVANIIGSPSFAKTELYVGLNPEVFERYHDLMATYNELKCQYNSLIRTIGAIRRAGHEQKLKEKRKQMLESSIHSARYTKANMKVLQEKIKDLVPRLNMNGGVINVTKVIHPGVKVQLGNAVMFVKNEIYTSTVFNSGGHVKLNPLISNKIILKK